MVQNWVHPIKNGVQAIFQLKTSEKTKNSEIENLTAQNHAINTDVVTKTDECSTLVNQLAKMEHKFADVGKKLRDVEIGKKSHKKISESLAKKYDEERNNLEMIKVLVQYYLFTSFRMYFLPVSPVG